MKPAFEKTYHDAEETQWWFVARREMVVRFLQNVSKEARILEIGCSGGPLLAMLKSRGFTNVRGIDISSSAIETCKARGIVSASVADGAKTGFPDASFDVVVASDVLEHISADSAALEDWNRILAPRGVLLLFVPAHRYLWSAHDIANEHQRRYRFREVRGRLNEAGFKIRRMGYWNVALFLPVVAYRIVSRFLPEKSRHHQLFVPSRAINATLLTLLRIENTFIAWGFRFPFGISIFAVAAKKDYRDSHRSEAKSAQYDDIVYAPSSYDSFVWEAEQGILKKELEYFEGRVSSLDYLDFACGSGRILVSLEGRVGDAVGVDIASEMITRARGRVKRASLYVGDVTAEPILGDKKFDLVTTFRFYLNAQPSLRDAAFVVLREHLRDKDSRLIFNVHGNRWSFRLITAAWMRLRGKKFNTASIRDVRDFLSRNQFELIHWYGIGIIPKFCYRFGGRWLFTLDMMLARIPGARYIANDLVFVCRAGRSSCR